MLLPVVSVSPFLTLNTTEWLAVCAKSAFFAKFASANNFLHVSVSGGSVTAHLLWQLQVQAWLELYYESKS